MHETLHTVNLKSCRKGRHHQQYPGKGPINADFRAILLFIFERLFESRSFNQTETIFCKALGGATGSSMSCTTQRNCFPLTKKLCLTMNCETMFILEVDMRLTSWVASLFRAQVATLQDPRCFMPASCDLQLVLPSYHLSFSMSHLWYFLIEVLIDLLRNKARLVFARWVCLNPLWIQKRKWPICVRSISESTSFTMLY